MVVFLTNDGNHLDRHLCGTAALEHDVTVRVDEVAAGGASEKGSGYEGIRIAVCVPAIDLLLQFPFAAWAAKLSVVGLMAFRFWSQLVLVTLDELPRKLGVQLLVDGHGE